MIKLIMVGLLLAIGTIVTFIYVSLNKEIKKIEDVWKETTTTKEEGSDMFKELIKKEEKEDKEE